MTAPTVLLTSAAPTAKATAWTPLIALSVGLLLVAGLFRLRDTPSETVVVMGAAGLAAALVLALRDPADALLAPLPVSRLTRRLLRLALVTVAAAPVWLAITLLLPGGERALAPLAALTLCGVAVATWLPVGRDVLPAAALPLVWATAAELLGGRSGVVGDAADLWVRHPWPVAFVAVVLVVLGRHR